MSNKNNFKYTLEQNKQKILLGASIVGVAVISFGVFTMVNNNKNKVTPEDDVYVDTTNVRAEYIIGGNDKGELDLIKVESNEVVKSTKLGTTENVIYSRSNDLEKVLAYGNGTFYEIVEENGDLISKELLKLEAEQPIKEFKFSDKYIVGNTGDKLIVFKLADKSTYMIDAKEVDSMVVIDETLVYAETENIHTYNLVTKEDKSIEIGDKTEDLFEINGSVVAFNKFGSGNQKSTILKLKSDDLYIEKAHRHDNEKLSAVTPDSDDKEIPYIDKTEKTVTINAHYKLDLNGEKDSKNRVTLEAMSTDNNVEFNSDNTVSTKGYLYSNKSGKIEIFRLAGEVMDSTVDSNKTFFMPISKEIETNNKAEK